jgi:tetratricopeptide (TPR) repeat protein
LGAALQQLGDYTDAAASFEAVLSLQTDQIARWHDAWQDALYQIGRIGSRSGYGLDRAVECLQRYLELEYHRISEPDDQTHSALWAHYHLGVICQRTNQSARAREQFEAALQIDPKQRTIMKALRELES